MKNLNRLLDEICTISNQSMSKDDAISKGKENYLYIEYASHYGGYRLVNVGVLNGGHSGAFNESSCVGRKPLKQMTNYLEGILYGLEYSAKTLKTKKL